MAKRGKTPSLISGSSGKPSSAVAKKKRSCTRCGTDILMGEKLFEIPKLGTGYSNKKPYCLGCFKEIIEQTKHDIAMLENEI